MLTQAVPRHHGDGRFTALPKLRTEIIDKIIAQFDLYFPEGSMVMFDVLMPSKLPHVAAETFVYAPKIYAFFG